MDSLARNARGISSFRPFAFPQLIGPVKKYRRSLFSSDSCFVVNGLLPPEKTGIVRPLGQLCRHTRIVHTLDKLLTLFLLETNNNKKERKKRKKGRKKRTEQLQQLGREKLTTREDKCKWTGKQTAQEMSTSTVEGAIVSTQYRLPVLKVVACVNLHTALSIPSQDAELFGLVTT